MTKIFCTCIISFNRVLYEYRKGTTNMKTIVIYKSKTGYTQQYAMWLAEELKCKAIKLGNVNKVNLSEYDTIIYGGGIYATNISGFKSFVKRLKDQTTKRILIFSVGSAAFSEDVRELIVKKNITDANLDYPLYYMQGGFDPEKLSFFMRFMLKMVASNIKKKQLKNPDAVSKDDQMFLDFFQTTHSNLNKDSLNPLIEQVKTYIN